MKFFNLKFTSGKTKSVTVIETWVVNWTKRYGSFSGDTIECYQNFIDKKSAEEFAESIVQAHKLIGNRGRETDVKLYKQKNGLE